jgi:hypothetical protein
MKIYIYTQEININPNQFIIPLLGGISFTSHKKMKHNNFGLDSFVTQELIPSIVICTYERPLSSFVPQHTFHMICSILLVPHLKTLFSSTNFIKKKKKCSRVRKITKQYEFLGVI